MKKRGKKGSHIGFMLSFVMFIVFLLFVYSLLQPTFANQKTKESQLEAVKAKLLENFRNEVTTISITTERSIPKPCIELKDFITGAGAGTNLVAKDKNENNLELRLLGGDDLQINRLDIEDFFFRIYDSEEFEELGTTQITPCMPLKTDNGGYAIEQTKSEFYISKAKILQAISDYASDINAFKNSIGISTSTDFSFSLLDETKTVIAETAQKEVSEEVYADEFLIQYVDADGISTGFINLRIW